MVALLVVVACGGDAARDSVDGDGDDDDDSSGNAK